MQANSYELLFMIVWQVQNKYSSQIIKIYGRKCKFCNRNLYQKISSREIRSHTSKIYCILTFAQKIQHSLIYLIFYYLILHHSTPSTKNFLSILHDVTLRLFRLSYFELLCFCSRYICTSLSRISHPLSVSIWRLSSWSVLFHSHQAWKIKFLCSIRCIP
jgi:hypothetical protein